MYTHTHTQYYTQPHKEKKYTESDRYAMPHQYMQIRK